MSYLVFARKYRPQTFNEVVQQRHITQTLINAIDSNRVAHAIIFSGPRGTGKTTVARILAKAMNCEKGPTSTPCGVCQSCKDITSGNAADVFEIDGASNNSVDQVRELRDNCRYMPQLGLNKIYIIDEVHMLSTSAFNALLKILEEPPSHVMFIFATTEPQKIPITILSRCQRYDLRRFDFKDISDHLKYILDSEKTLLPDESISLIAREADGCMRDALSLLDQVVACSEGTITHEKVIDILGVIDRAVIFSMADAFFEGNVVQLIEIINDIYSRGQDVKRLFWELIEHFRHLLIIKMGKKASDLIDLPGYELALLKTQSEKVSDNTLFQLIDMMMAEEATIKWALNPKLAIEVVFLRLMHAKPALSIDKLIQGLDDLKNHVGPLPVPAGIVKQPLIAEPSVSELPSLSSPSSDESIPAVSRPVIPKPAVSKLATSKPAGSPKAPPARVPKAKIAAPQKSVTPDIAPAPEDYPQSDNHHQGQGDDPKENSDRFSHQDIDFTSRPDIFLSKLIQQITRLRPSLAANLKKCRLKPIDENSFVLEVSGNNFNVKAVSKSIAFIEKECQERLKRKICITVELNTKEQEKTKVQAKEKLSAKHKALDHPLIASAIEIFNGKIIDIKSHKEG